MYVSKHHRLEDRAIILELIEQHPLGAWVCHDTEGLIANHVPFFLDREQGPYGTLIGHVSRANEVWRRLGDKGLASVIMFQGPQAYITPGWYRAADDKSSRWSLQSFDHRSWRQPLRPGSPNSSCRMIATTVYQWPESSPSGRQRSRFASRSLHRSLRRH